MAAIQQLCHLLMNNRAQSLTDNRKVPVSLNISLSINNT
ncbi:hypothetical protein yfred0001_1170 [Yersinia frederiksenii ATCC 33641]|nr:hypothetical protein yfred0001_1170 [Yersinia frederiksenii ATCC 33641]